MSGSSSETAASPSGRLPWTLRHGYGFGALGFSIANTAILFFLLKFLVDGAGLSPGIAGTVLLVGKAWDAVTDPVVGRLTDSTRSAMGSRRPWIVGAALPFALLFGALWWDLPLEGALKAVGYAALLVAYNTAYTAVVVPYGALTPVLTEDYDERTRLNAARMEWSIVGGILAGVAMPTLRDLSSWGVAGLVLGAATIAPLLVAVAVTRGRDRVGQVDGRPSAPWAVLRSGPFRRTALLFLVAWTSIAWLAALLPFYVEHHLHHPEMLDLVFLVLQVGALVTIPAVVWLAGRLQKHRAYALSLATWGVMMLAVSLIPEGTGYWALLPTGLAGLGVAAAHVLPWSMLPDVVEHDRVETGHDRAGAFYGMMTFLEKSATAGALWFLGMGLEIGGYVEGAAEQSEGARATITWLVGPVPTVVLLLAAVFAWRFPPLTREAHRRLVEALEEAS